MEKDSFRNRIRLRHIHCFLAVAQERNLGRAAERMRLTQPAISKTLSELEDIAGARLFERNRQGAQLTADGEKFLTHALGVLDALDAVSTALGAEQAPQRETVRVGALPTVAPALLPGALQEFRRNHAQAHVAIQTAANASLLHILKAGEVDFVLGRMADPQMMVGLSFELLYVEPLLLVVSAAHPLSPLMRQGAVSLGDVVGFPAVVSPKGTIPRHNTESFLQAHGLAVPENCTETLSVSVSRQIVQHSDAVWFTPAGAARDDLAAGTLARLPVSTKGTEEPVGLLHRSEGTLSSAAREFVRILREMAVARRVPEGR
jgi:pca operon transcription factor PcaQ